ncbi:unnamed protein product [Mytilus coruscus]|uniref:Uncharacterized protein n=1 Tax=Mytilus coruscus TaxID=42192 RepID=A0A6J8C5B5_MYTCO|nr:unnamed protein product [Mytilus coruscus]
MVNISNIVKGLYEDCLECKNNLLNKETKTLSETNTVYKSLGTGTAFKNCKSINITLKDFVEMSNIIHLYGSQLGSKLIQFYSCMLVSNILSRSIHLVCQLINFHRWLKSVEISASQNNDVSTLYCNANPVYYVANINTPRIIQLFTFHSMHMLIVKIAQVVVSSYKVNTSTVDVESEKEKKVCYEVVGRIFYINTVSVNFNIKIITLQNLLNPVHMNYLLGESFGKSVMKLKIELNFHNAIYRSINNLVNIWVNTKLVKRNFCWHLIGFLELFPIRINTTNYYEH